MLLKAMCDLMAARVRVRVAPPLLDRLLRVMRQGLRTRALERVLHSPESFRPGSFPPLKPELGKDKGEHVIESLNCSGGKSTLKKRLKVTRPFVAIVQEFGHVADQ
eukprot:3688787-Pyramimonas_sp.AAC.1